MAKSRGKQTFLLQAMRWGSMHPGAQIFFQPGQDEGVGFFCSQCLPMKFPIDSQHLPSSSSLHIISFALSSTLVTYVTDPKAGNRNISMLGLSKAFFFWLWWTNQKMPITKGKKMNLLGPQKEISMSHNILPSLYFYIKYTSRGKLQHIILDKTISCNKREGST